MNTSNTKSNEGVAYSPNIHTVRAIVAKHLNEYPNALLLDLAESLTLKDQAHKAEVEKQGKRFVTLMNQAIGETKLPEEVWKKIAKVNQLILDK